MTPSRHTTRTGRRLSLLVSIACVASLGSGVRGGVAMADQNEQPGSVAQASVSAGSEHTCVIVGASAVRCWGEGRFGQLGLAGVSKIGDDEYPTTNVNLGGVNATAVSTAAQHTCALIAGGAVRCWGWNLYGELGLGNTTQIGDNESPTSNVNLGGPTATAITTGSGFTCALLAGGSVRCWGRNTSGQLGLGNTTQIGDDENPTTNVNLGGATVTAISSGYAHTCVLLSTGSVRCWGWNIYGQLGLGNTTQIGDDENPTTNVDLGGSTAIAIAAGDSHTCALLTGGAVRCWGLNLDGELGIGNTIQIGDNESPTANVNLGGATPTAITAGQRHTCALLNSGGVRCWGLNSNGQLGLGNVTTIGDNENPTTNVNLGGATATAVAAGDRHSCAVLMGGAVRCWGYNLTGELGLGNTATVGDNESPTINVPSTVVGIDATAPALSIDSPSPNQATTTPVSVQGTTSDTSAVTAVAVAIYRNVAGGQYWNGISWQAANTTVAATLTNPNSTTSNWNYTFNAPPGGVFAVAAIAYDATGNFSVAPYQTFKITDNLAPTVFNFANPTPGQALTTRPVTIDGIVTDDVGIGDVQIALYRPVGPGQFWNGAVWQTAYTTVTATLGQPGSNSTNFVYSFNPPQTGGLYYAAVIALDTSYNYAISAFRPFTLPDAATPAATLTTPANGATTAGTINITGTATDNNAIALVGIAIYRASTSQYWNGATWQAGFATVPATMATPGNTSTTFTATFSPPAAGYYLIAALPIDGNYNYSLTGFNTVNAT